MSVVFSKGLSFLQWMFTAISQWIFSGIFRWLLMFGMSDVYNFALISEFRDVVFEDVVSDNNRLALSYN